MTLSETLAELESLGTEQNRKTYARHGAGGEMYGVSFANLNKMAKTIKKDQALAEELWKTGNHDARVLATMIADPEKIKSSQLDAWGRDLDNYGITGLFSSLVGKTPHAQTKAEKWAKSKGEWTGQAGWNLIAGLAYNKADLPDTYFEERLKEIEAGIHSGKNWVRYAMNGALIAIGVRNPKLEKKAKAAAKRIGVVEVDHGQTNCKTPQAISYIDKTIEKKGHQFGKK